MPKLALIALEVVIAVAVVGCGSPAPDDDVTDAGVTDGGMRDAADGDPPPSTPRSTLDRATYLDQLAGLWMGQSIANWTGLITEGRVNAEPYLTDDDWDGEFEHGRPGSAEGVLSFNFQDPWLSDDDTDFEYLYLEAMTARGTPYLSGEDIRDAWLMHTEPGAYIWVSNLAAQSLMFADPAVIPPSTSFLAANDQSLMIDAQLTTELFGALAPGMPRRALALADLPIRTSASGYAEHAAQMFVVMYSLAAVVDPDLTPREAVLWLAQTSRKFVPDTSKTADVFDFVLGEYMSNPDVDDWESTRDAIALRFGPEAETSGEYLYLEWYDSAVNFATAILALLFGEGDLPRTIQIGSLSGWDSDNGTATMGGLLGMMLGTDEIRAQFPDVEISDRYEMVTRVGFDETDDTFGAIALRMAPLVDTVVEAGGGASEPTSWSIAVEDLVSIDATDNPRVREGARSVNNHLRSRGMEPTVAVPGSEVLRDADLDGYAESSAPVEALIDGLEFDVSGSDRRLPVRTVETFPGDDMRAHHVALEPSEGDVVVEIVYPLSLSLAGVQLVEGPEWSGRRSDFVAVTVEARSDGEWSEVSLRSSYAAQPERLFETQTLEFSTPVTADAIRVRVTPSRSVVTLCEVDAMLAD